MKKLELYVLLAAIGIISIISFLGLRDVVLTGNAIYTAYNAKENLKITCCSECLMTARNQGKTGNCAGFVSGKCEDFFLTNEYNVEDCRLE